MIVNTTTKSRYYSPTPRQVKQLKPNLAKRLKGDWLTTRDILMALKTIGLCTHLDAPRQRSDLTFDQVLSVFLREKRPTKNLTLPLYTTKGRKVDLLSLFCYVRKKGGYASVNSPRSWGAMAKLIGLKFMRGPSVKRIYLNYLKELERSIKRVCANFLKKKVDPTSNHPFRWPKELQRKIKEGPKHQAIIPNRTKNKSYSDHDPALKYLGTRICSPDIFGQKHMIKREKCKCLVPGSIDCVKFHIDENRLALKRELGPLFLEMGFRSMGEHFSDSWKGEEQENFKFVIRENPPSKGCKFWGELKKKFKHKNYKCLVNYYFNVFMLRRRAYQNRMIPDKIDSADNTIELGFLDA